MGLSIRPQPQYRIKTGPIFKAYSEPSQTSEMEIFAKIFNSF